ncbi:NAD(P)H-dependent oxidoreductase (plasmid) [Rhizobium sp. CB3171]|uniref:NADPH-dependent FMN reductase n=1 Tax=unclassified Rhizobium TaxID=2613769 RepID=UPI0021A6E3CD|nr:MULTISPECIES: NADPH-dependent FMN reductase [Rhizobium]MDK4740211.1 NAD(P)H-dependent oxidoreductase [Rhizobium sp. CNPSo 3464]UWU24973.1 NAD(P)H-dependent oxidoreductase [Rhizobium tropici]WFU06455.1 NAD(P)H-dependent oxidoreductase [Rhizobium sp. CB3171]
MKILGISGSLRKGSFNTALLHAAVALAPPGVELIAGTIHGIPLYDADVEAEGIPEKVSELKELAAASDGLILFTPEYNNSLPGVFKNAIDWMSRPPSDIPRVFRAKPVAVLGASPGNFGTILSQTAWLPVLRTLGANPWFGGRLMVSRAGSVFDAEGQIVDEKVKQNLAAFVEGFAAFVESTQKS